MWGGMSGPSAVGAIADGFGGSLQIGIAFGIVFPIIMFVAAALYREKKGVHENAAEKKSQSDT